MYDEEFGTDWESLTVEEGARRAYALGVSATLGNPRPHEIDRLQREIGRAYDRSIVELAYEEGKNRARKLRNDADSDEAIWKALVEAEPITAGMSDPKKTHAPSVVSRVGLLDPPGDGLDRIRLPSLLKNRR